METGVKACLKDIEQVINEINAFLPEKKDFSQFQNDVKTRRAVERNIEILGEAISRIVKVSPELRLATQEKSLTPETELSMGMIRSLLIYCGV